MSPFGIPTPAHALTPAAEDARAAVRRHGALSVANRAGALIVTEHGQHVEPYTVTEWRTTKKGKKKRAGTIPGPRPSAASVLERKAIAAGWTVNVFETPGRVRTVVEGIRGELAFRAVWHRGKAESGTWHERRWRYAMVNDPRPVGVAKITLTALAGKRAAGVDSTHLAIVASPWGLPVGVSEISKRVSAT